MKRSLLAVAAVVALVAIPTGRFEPRSLSPAASATVRACNSLPADQMTSLDVSARALGPRTVSVPDLDNNWPIVTSDECAFQPVDGADSCVQLASSSVRDVVVTVLVLRDVESARARAAYRYETLKADGVAHPSFRGRSASGSVGYTVTLDGPYAARQQGRVIITVSTTACSNTASANDDLWDALASRLDFSAAVEEDDPHPATSRP